MLRAIAPDLWDLPYHFDASGLRLMSRMTVLRLGGNRLWLHSPVPLSPQLRAQLDALGEVAFIVAPSKTHYLFAGDCAVAYPKAALFGAPGLARKRPELAGMRTLGATAEPEWADEMDQVFVGGIPIGNETAFFHRASGTLIVSDLCQWWQGDMPFTSRVFAMATGVRTQLAVPRTIRLAVKDRAAVAASAQQILQWPFTRVVMAHNAIVEENAHEAVQRALSIFRN